MQTARLPRSAGADQGAASPRAPGRGPQTPQPDARTPATAVVNDRAAERLRSGHVWVFASEVLGWEPAPPPAPALTGRVRDRRGRMLGVADFSPLSEIRLRLLSRDADQPIGPAWFRRRLEQAIAWRRHVIRDSDAYRVVAAEADALPGLIVDRYGPALVIQTLTWAMAQRQTELIALLDELLAPAALVERNDVRVRQKEGLELRAGLLRGANGEVDATINGLRFHFDLLAGQKTGGFLDQRENWAAAGRWVERLGLKTALDVFCYQGGFALQLARSGAKVEATDSSRPALEVAERNASANGLIGIDWIEANAFDLLRDYDAAGRQIGAVVLDPPAFAKSRARLESAMAGYKEINLRALKVLQPGGVLVSCSCSHHVSEVMLLEVIRAAAADARVPLRVLERRTQGLDHPSLVGVPESNYLKCIIAMRLPE
ncbi:MAG: class I SAM-dependent rRNA methyltransferase [Terriglobales bacterium]